MLCLLSCVMCYPCCLLSWKHPVSIKGLKTILVTECFAELFCKLTECRPTVKLISFIFSFKQKLIWTDQKLGQVSCLKEDPRCLYQGNCKIIWFDCNVLLHFGVILMQALNKTSKNESKSRPYDLLLFFLWSVNLSSKQRQDKHYYWLVSRWQQQQKKLKNKAS